MKRGGRVKCEEVASEFGTLEKVRALQVEELSSLKGWAQKSAEDFVTSLRQKSTLIDELTNWISVEETIKPESNLNSDENQSASKVAGLKFCITGTLSRSRSEYEKAIQLQGGKVMSSVSKATSYLVCNEVSSSSKYKNAQKLEIPIITEADLSGMLNLP